MDFYIKLLRRRRREYFCVLFSQILGCCIFMGTTMEVGANEVNAPVLQFFDVPTMHNNFEAVQYLSINEIVNGFEDGSFRPDQTISRAAFTKIIIGVQFSSEEIDACLKTKEYQEGKQIFSDTPLDQWYAPYVCIAKKNEIIGGFPDGSFGPEKSIAFPAAAKILVRSLSLKTTPKPTQEWYVPYISALSEKKAIPPTVQHLNYQIKRGDMAEMVWRLKENITNKSFATGESVINSNCTPFDFQNIPGVDMERVRSTWISWYNDERRGATLPAYKIEDQLNRSATIWSEYSAKVGSMSHKRPEQTAYYDYQMIVDWFAELGLTFKNINSITYTENIGYGHWNCINPDCTAELISEIRKVFEMYLSEKNQQSRPHYNAIFNPFFSKIGLGISVNKDQKRYYLTTHFAVGFLEEPKALCK